jgi:diguanylate cyclase (GGDEF)-like protein/PAS domain S-box-containing protein
MQNGQHSTVGRPTLTAARARALLLDPQTRAKLDRFAPLAGRALRAPVSTLGVPDSDRMVLASQLRVPEPWASAWSIPMDAALCPHVIAMGRVLTVPDMARHPAGLITTPLENFPRAAYCGAPVMVEDQPVAVLSVIDARPRQWSREEIGLLTDLAAVIRRELERLAVSLGRDDEPTPPPAVPVDDEKRYRRLFEATRTPILLLDSDGLLVEHNPAFAALVGAAGESLAGLHLSELVVDRNAAERMMEEVREQGAVAGVELALHHRGDGEVVCQLAADTVTIEGRRLLHASLYDLTRQKREQEELVRAAFQDPLTGLPNRIVFMDRLGHVLKHSKRHAGYRFAVLFLDLDNFKQINDTHGHLIGDQLLREVARRLESCVRQEDTVARLSGDEFAILLDTIGDLASVTVVVERIREALGEQSEVQASIHGITASIGIAISVSGYDHPEDLLRDADEAMYRAKGSGRNDYIIFDSDMHDRAVEQRRMEEDLRAAMEREELSLHYQPVVELESGSVAGLEALIRWSHPHRGLLLPGEFMPLAEQTGLVVEFGWWVLREACGQLRTWQLEYPDVAFRLTMGVNLSARQFLHPSLVPMIDAILAETGLDPGSLRLDLTEAVVMRNIELAARLLAQLRERGIQICIDDFGTGYTSLRRLSEFPISVLKIDPSFVRRLGADEGGLEVVQTIIALGESMSIDAIAEGVETPEQLEQLRRLGTRFAQGFLFSLPLDAHGTAVLLRESQS